MEKTTVYHQQSQYIRDNKLITDPLSMFDDDLTMELYIQMVQSKHIILMLDINQNANYGVFNREMNNIRAQQCIPY